MRLPGDASKPLVIAEGPENADSVAAPSGFEAWATLGPIPRIEPPAGRDVIVLSDGDDPDKPAAIDLEAWVAKWRALGRRIVIARPHPEWTGHKYDFNDLLREQGPEAVRARLEAARQELRQLAVGAELAAPALPNGAYLSPSETNLPAFYPPITESREDAEYRLSLSIKGFFRHGGACVHRKARSSPTR